MKKILVINGHPDTQSFNHALFEAYIKGALESGAAVESLVISKLSFNPNLECGYRKRTELEPDLVKAQKMLQWAEHIVWIFPVWWGSVPALMKGFIDRVFLPGFAFNKREKSLWWDKLLTKKSGRLITTLDQPAWYYRWINKQPSTVAMKRLTLQFVGVNKVKTTSIGPLRLSKESYRKSWLKKVERLGQQQK